MLNQINLALALLAVPADLIMLVYLIRDRVHQKANGTRTVLIALFVAIFLSSLANALFYILRINDAISIHPAANLRSLSVNLSLTTIAWIFVAYVRNINKEK